MSVLALDSCHRGVLIAVLCTPEGILLDKLEVEESLAIAIPKAIDKLLRDDTTTVVVVNGPGSYTGTRAGLAAAIALVSAKGLELHASNRLLALAATTESELVVSGLDAGRGGIYIQAFRSLSPESEPRHLTLGDWIPPAGYTLLSDTDAPGFTLVSPEKIALAAVRIGVQQPCIVPEQLQATYVSVPSYARTGSSVS